MAVDDQHSKRGWEGCLEAIGWLDELSPAELDAVARTSAYRQVARGTVIFSPTEKPESVFIIQRGLVRIFRVSKRGDELTLGYVGSQEVVGELSGFCGFPRESHAIAIAPCQVCAMPHEIFHGILDNHPGIARDVVSMISRRFKRLESRLVDVVFRDTFERLCAILLELAEDFGRPEAGGQLITVPLTQTEIAALIGSVRQTVNPLVRRLEEAGHLARRDGHFIVLDKHALKQASTSFP